MQYFRVNLNKKKKNEKKHIQYYSHTSGKSSRINEWMNVIWWAFSMLPAHINRTWNLNDIAFVFEMHIENIIV